MADDALRGDLANATDPTKGATLVRQNTYETVRDALSRVVPWKGLAVEQEKITMQP